MPDGGKSRKGDLAREVCTNQDMAEVENVRLGAKGLCFFNVAGVDFFCLRKSGYLSAFLCGHGKCF